LGCTLDITDAGWDEADVFNENSDKSAGFLETIVFKSGAGNERYSFACFPLFFDARLG
jgi:hypothetical protein